MLTDFLLLWIVTGIKATPITVDVHHRSLSRRDSNPATAHSNIPSDINSTTSTPIILTSLYSSSDAPSLQLPSLPVDWMHQNLATLGCHPLRHLTLPGTHDSGMSTLTHSTFLSIPEKHPNPLRPHTRSIAPGDPLLRHSPRHLQWHIHNRPLLQDRVVLDWRQRPVPIVHHRRHKHLPQHQQ